MLKELLTETLEGLRCSLMDGEFFSAASAKIMAGHLESSLLNKFDFQRKPEEVFKESIAEILDYNGIT